MLPLEIVNIIFSYISPNDLYDKFLGPYDWDGGPLTAIQHAAFERVFSAKMVVRSKGPESLININSRRVFYPAKVLRNSLVVGGLDKGYQLLKKLFNFNIEYNTHIIPQEFGLIFNFNDTKNRNQEILDLAKVLEILSFDNYYQDVIPKIVIELRYHVTPYGTTIIESNKVVRKIETLGHKITKFLIHNKYSLKTPINNLDLLYPAMFNNLQEMRLWNCGVTDQTIKTYFKILPSGLKIFDLSFNNITSLHTLVLPVALEQLLISANSLQSISGPDYKSATRLHFIDASINAISSIEGIKFPDSLRQLKITHNLLTAVDQDQIPPQLKVLALSQNSFDTIDNIQLPVTLTELHLRSNRLKGFTPDFFMYAQNLTILDLADNLIDDLDDLGYVPESLTDIMLDNNEIDNSDLNNIFTSSLTKLSMSHTGLVSLDNIRFPEMIRELKLSKNELSQINSVEFGAGRLSSLDLNTNNLTHFPTLHSLQSVKVLDLSDNPFHSWSAIIIPPSVEYLALNDISCESSIPQSFIDRLPRSIKSLSMCNCLSDYPPQPFKLQFKRLLNLQELKLERNNISSIQDVTYPCELQSLSYDVNEITELRLDGVPTNIKVIKFNGNKIKDIGSLPFFPQVEFLGIYGNQTDLMRSGSYFAKP